MSQTAERGNWDEDFDSKSEKTDNGNGDRKAVYMDMSKPGNYKVRLVGPHIKCRKHFKPYKATVQDSEKDVDPAWKAGFFPSRRFAINVIDKTGLKAGETGVLKILEKGPQVFKFFANYKAVVGIDPASPNGPDFNIKVDMTNKDDPMSTEYTVMPLEKAPLTEAEKKLIYEYDKDGNVVKDETTGKAKTKLFQLTKIYQSTSAEKMKEMWDALTDAQKIAPKKSNSEKNGNSDKKVGNKPSSPVVQPKEEIIQENMDDSPADSAGNEELFNVEEPKATKNADNSSELW